MKRARQQKVMIVDDDPLNLTILTEVVRPLPVEISTAQNGRTALRLIEEQQPDLILLDITMPDISGIEVCRRVKAHPVLRKIPIIFVTAMTDVNNQTEATEVGGSAFLTKPVRKVLVLSTVQQALRLKGYTDEIESYAIYFDRLQALRKQELLIPLRETSQQLAAAAAVLHDELTRERAGTIQLLLASQLRTNFLQPRVSGMIEFWHKALS